MATPASGVDKWLTLNGVPLSFRPDDDNISAGATEYGSNRIRITPEAPNDLEIRVDNELLETERYGYWTWMPRGFAGLYQFQVRVPGYTPLVTQVRVIPSKFSFDRYQQMLADISEISLDLLFQLYAPTAERATSGRGQQPASALRDYELIYAMMADLRAVMAEIRRNPHRTLTSRVEMRLLPQVHQFSSEAWPIFGPNMEMPGMIGQDLGLKTLPQAWMVQNSSATYDVYENRLLKHFLWRQLLSRISAIESKAQSEIIRREHNRKIKLAQGWKDDETEKIEWLEGVIEDCHKMTNWCIAWAGEPFLRNVADLSVTSRPSQVLQKHPHYSRFYRLYLQFQQELTLNLEASQYLTTLSLRKMSELYETWSVFQVTRLILPLLEQAGYRIISSQGFFKIRDDLFHFEVDRDAKIELAKADHRIVIRYEPRYPSTNEAASGLVAIARNERRPDLAIEVWSRGQVNIVLVFDAKYKTEPDGDLQTFMEDDVAKMGDYLHVIRWKARNIRIPQRVVSSAYILYPGDVVEHDPYLPESGALPLSPKLPHLKQVKVAVKQILKHAGLL